jgi:hypothetical protein
MQPYYYMVYAIRRMLGSSRDAGRDHGEWRAVAFFLMIPVQLLIVGIAFFFPGVFDRGTALALALGVGIPVFVATYWLMARRELYARYVARFDSWSARKRALADVCALTFVAASVAVPILARSLAG